MSGLAVPELVKGLCCATTGLEWSQGCARTQKIISEKAIPQIELVLPLIVILNPSPITHSIG